MEKLKRPLLRPVTAQFDGYPEQMMRLSSTCLIRVDRQRHRVTASAAGLAVAVCISANQLRVATHGEVIPTYSRMFDCAQLICDPWHSLPVLGAPPGTRRNAAPFVAWDLPVPVPVQRVRDRILHIDWKETPFITSDAGTIGQCRFYQPGISVGTGWRYG